jgi:WD40 repeat protein
MISFVDSDDSVLTTRLRLREQARLSWKLPVGIGAAALLLVGLAVWSFSGKERRPPTKGVVEPNQLAAEAQPEPRPPDRIVRELPGPFGNPTCLAWSPTGAYLAVGTLDGDVTIRTPDHRNLHLRYSEHASSVVALTWIPKSELIVSAEDAGEIHLWNSTTGKTLKRIKRTPIAGYGGGTWHSRLACSPDGSELIYADGTGTLVRVSVPDGERLGTTIALAGGSVLADACYSPSGKQIAISSNLNSSFSVTVANLRPDADEPMFPINTTMGTPAPVASPLMVAFVNDDELAIACPKRLEVWNLAERHLARQFDIPQCDQSLPGWTRQGGVTSRAPRFAYWVDGVLNLKSPEDGAILPVTVPMPGIIDYSCATLLDFTPDLGHLAYWMGGISIARVTDGETRRPWGNEFFGALTEQPSIHGDVLLRHSGEQTWDLRTGKLRTDLAGKLFAISAEGQVQVLDGDLVRSYQNDPENAKEAAPPVKLQERDVADNLYGCRWSRDGRRLFQFRDDRVLHIWDTQTGRKIAALHPEIASAGYDATYNGTAVVMTSGQQNFLSFEPHAAPPYVFTAGVDANWQRFLTSDRQYLVWNHPSMHYRIADRRPFPLRSTALSPSTDPDHGIESSRTGEYLLMNAGIWKLSAAGPQERWECPEKPRAVHLIHNSTIYVGGAWFDDEDHVAIVMDAAIHIWNWRKKHKRATIYLMPDKNWAFVNHETRSWIGSPGADRYLRYEEFDAAHDTTIRVTKDAYHAETGWKNDPTKAGLDLGKRIRDLAGQTKAD